MAQCQLRLTVNAAVVGSISIRENELFNILALVIWQRAVLRSTNQSTMT